MAVVGLATAAGFWLKSEMLGRHFDLRLTVFVCAFVSAVLSAAAILFSLRHHPAHSHSHKRALPCAGHTLPEFVQRPHLQALYMLYKPFLRCRRHHVLPFGRSVRGHVADAGRHVLITSSQKKTKAMISEILQDALFAAIAAIGFAAISRPPHRAYLYCAIIAAAGHSLRFWLMNATYGYGMHIVVATLIATFAIGLLAVFLSPVAHMPPRPASSRHSYP